ncbi:MAG: flagellar basal body-associated FliL family protein [Bdellovibrionaceae bacterium]|nr:flagellar basal body-associated FliL family protein [Pseudobdellovibrionaceae bacterium]MBX3033108.1 flagellar basal body-associated FliL family protein [Pseudobdellovibrionaceae bacterium]
MADAENQQAPKKSLNMGLILSLAFALVNLGAMGGGAYLVYASTIGWQNPTITENDLRTEEEKLAEANRSLDPFIYTMDKFTVNLDGEPRRTIRVEVNLEMLAKDGFEEVINTENRAKARDRIVRILNEKNFSDLETIQGKLFLKDRIALEVNGLLRDGVVKDVFFSEFVVQ